MAQAHADNEARMITGDEMATRIVAELARCGRLAHGYACDADHDRRVVARVINECLREAFRLSIDPGPIGATLDEIDRLGEPFDDEATEVTAS